jgi:hypothetical protein
LRGPRASEAGPGAAHARRSRARAAHPTAGSARTGFHRGATDNERLRDDPWQGLHREHPRRTTNPPDTVGSSSSRWGRRATEERSSPARMMEPELIDGEGADSLGWEAALGFGEALRPAHGEKGGVRWLGTDGVLESRGECGGDGLPEADIVLARTRRRGWPPFIAVHCIEATQAALRERKELTARCVKGT